MEFSKNKLSIWALALGYFAFYVPYSGTTKLLSKGIFSKSGASISGFELLPMVLIGTLIGFIAILLITGWWKQAGKLKIGGITIPFVTNKYALFSGIATAVIIATTTLAYSFTGMSIVFAALLMRGGVLIMAPFIDVVYRRKIQWYSWLAFGLTLFSLLIVFSEKTAFNIGLAAGINIAAYLTGYFFRLQFITYSAKSDDAEKDSKFFVEEMMSAMLTLLIIPIILAIIGQGEFMLSIRAGYTSLLSSEFIIPGLFIGILYSCLYIFGSRIYLNNRENTFCIPINRCASLLAGVTTSILLSIALGETFYTNTQLIGAIVLIAAMFALSTPRIIELIQQNIRATQRTYIFVCPGNTGRSPMAQAICIDKMTEQLKAKGQFKRSKNINIFSAGLTAEDGISLNSYAESALNHLEVEVLEHSSRKLSLDDIKAADKIWCMSSEHTQFVLDNFPEAHGKVNNLDANDQIPTVHGSDVTAYIRCARKLEELIDGLIQKKEIEFS